MAFAVQCALVSASPVQLQSERASTASSSSHRVRVSVRDSSFLQTKFSGSAFQPPAAKKHPAGTTLVVRAQRVKFKANRTVTIPFREGEFAADEYLKETERVVKVTFPDSTRIEYLGDQKWRSRLRPLTFINVTATPTVEVRVSFEKGSLRLYSDTLSLDFTGVPDSFAVADFSFLLDGNMRAVPRSPGAVTVRHNCDFTGSVSLGMSTDLPAAFALIPEGIVTGAGDEILDRIIGAMEGALLQGIIRDYNIWSRMKSRKSVAKKQPLRTSSTEGSQDSLTEDETWISEERLAAEERRLAEEQSRRRQEELVRQALEEARIKKEGELLFQMSQRAYGRGVYDKSVEMLEAALTKVPGNSNLGGEIQVWLAMAYDAVGRHADCIALYKQLEGSHPNKILRKQAADLRYIAEAPKLKISRDEMVKIPLIEKDYDRKAKTWSQLVKEKRKKPMNKSAAQTKDYLEDWLVWTPPRWEKSPYFWVAVTIWLTMVGVSLVFQN